MASTQYSYMTEEELIVQVEQNNDSTPMERELADRLDNAIDYIDSLLDELEELEENLP